MILPCLPTTQRDETAGGSSIKHQQKQAAGGGEAGAKRVHTMFRAKSAPAADAALDQHTRPPPRRPTNPKKEKKKSTPRLVSGTGTTGQGASSSRQVQSRHGRGGAGGARPEERCYAYARKIRLLARVRVTTKGKGKWEVVEPITRRREAHETNAAAAAVQGCVWWLRSNATRGWGG